MGHIPLPMWPIDRVPSFPTHPCGTFHAETFVSLLVVAGRGKARVMDKPYDRGSPLAGMIVAWLVAMAELHEQQPDKKETHLSHPRRFKLPPFPFPTSVLSLDPHSVFRLRYLWRVEMRSTTSTCTT